MVRSGVIGSKNSDNSSTETTTVRALILGLIS